MSASQRTSATTDSWREPPSISVSEAAELGESPGALGDYLAKQFTGAFGPRVEEVTFDRFPDGLYATLYVESRRVTVHNVWASIISSALGDAGVDVSVVVLPVSDLLR